MKWLRKLFGVETAEDYCREQLRLITKAGRRCAYDLRHAAACVGDSELRKIYYDRADMWQGVFNPGDDGKNYRDRLHMEIIKLENHVDRLEKILKENNLDFPPLNDIPF